MNLSINRGISEKIRAPRTLFVHFPHGASFGEPGNANQQLTILRDLLALVYEATEPGAIVDATYRWRRTEYALIGPEAFAGLGPTGA